MSEILSKLLEGPPVIKVSKTRLRFNKGRIIIMEQCPSTGKKCLNNDSGGCKEGCKFVHNLNNRLKPVIETIVQKK